MSEDQDPAEQQAFSDEDILERIEDEAEAFPPQMQLIDEVFQFSFDATSDVLKAYPTTVELISAIRRTRDFIERSRLDDFEKAQIADLLNEEAEVVSFAQTCRTGVISL